MKNNFNISDLILINQFVQGIKDLEYIHMWFNNLCLLEKRQSLINIWNLIIQSHPLYEDIEKAIILSKRKASSTPAVMLLNKRKPFFKFGYEVSKLPDNELIKALDILLYTLSLSDNRRKENEDPLLCNHWWHKDLRNEEYIIQLLNNETQI